MVLIWILIAVVVLVLIAVCGLLVFPLINNHVWSSLTEEQQCLTLTQKARKLTEFKNLSSGTQGRLYYVVNKRKVLIYPWRLNGSQMEIVKADPFDCWNYPARSLTQEERKKAQEDLDEYTQKHCVKIIYSQISKEQ